MKAVGLLLAVVLVGVLGFLVGGGEGVAISLESWGLAFEVAVLATWPVRKGRAGNSEVTLTKSGRHQWLMVAAGVSSLVGGAMGFLNSSGILSERLLNAVVMLLAPLFILEATVPTRLTAKGMLQFARFLPWSKVGAYSWRGKHLLLWASSGTPLPWWGLAWANHRSIGVSVPERDRTKVEAFLRGRLPGGRVDDVLRRLLGAGGDPEPETALRIQAEVKAELENGNDEGALRALREGINASEAQAREVLARLGGGSREFEA